MPKNLLTYQGISPPPTYPSASITWKTLTLYLSIIEDAVGSMFAQEDNDKNETAIYYLSKRFHDNETRYTPIKSHAFHYYETYRLTFPNMGGRKNGPTEVSL